MHALQDNLYKCSFTTNVQQKSQLAYSLYDCSVKTTTVTEGLIYHLLDQLHIIAYLFLHLHFTLHGNTVHRDTHQ